MDANRLRTGELIAGISGVVLLIVMFFSWFGVPDIDTGVPGLDVEGIAEASGVDTTANAWQAFEFIDLVLLVTVIIAVGLAIATAMAQSVSLPVAASALTAGLGILATALVLYRLINPPADLSREFGVFLGLIAALGIAYGGWRSMQEEGTTFAGEADRIGDRDTTPARETTVPRDTTTGPGTTSDAPPSEPPPPPPPRP